jgi:hypothetical protein
MPFGRYRRWSIQELPDSYLEWLLTINLRSWLYAAARAEYDRRTEKYSSRDDRTPPLSPASPGVRIRPEEAPLVWRVFDAGYWTLARTMHPDVRGDVHAMQQFHARADSVLTQIDLLEVAK